VFSTFFGGIFIFNGSPPWLVISVKLVNRRKTAWISNQVLIAVG